MCGIFGFVQKDGFFSKETIREVVDELFLLSESRGKEASGFAIKTSDKTLVYKSALPASKTIKTEEYRDTITEYTSDNFCIIGHSRLVTNGYEHFNENNQPFIKNDIVGIHNGIIVNIDDLWQKYTEEKRLSDLDSEIIPTLIRRELSIDNNLSKAIINLYHEIYGMTSIALLFPDFKNLLLATNNGSLYYICDTNLFIFASESYILKKLIEKFKLLNNLEITHLSPSTFLSLHIHNISISLIDEKKNIINFHNIEKNIREHQIVLLEHHLNKKQKNLNQSLNHIEYIPPDYILKEYESNKERIKGIKRCTRCLLPATIPFIEFDENGVCNKCLTYEKQKVKGRQSLEDISSKYRHNDGTPDCIVAFSGGRDSSYSLHFVKKELGLTPLAFSYDWGMITDLARRNQARMCGELGIEHILVSADIRNKRNNIHLNVNAWLKQPHLGTIPLFMAGDKQYFYHAEKLKKQNNIELLIMGENHFEKTGFKIEFSGARQQKKGYMSYHMSLRSQMQMMMFYVTQYLKNPSYINRSLFDTAGAFLSYYSTPHDYLNLFDYIKWNEKEIENILLNDYDWELETGYQSTWRIGDGTAPFYNYIYYTVAGFTENESLRSNQIREGIITRDEGLTLIEHENRPRWSAIKWYLDTIKINTEEAINKINKITKLY